MVRSNVAIANMVGGELSPLMRGRSDLPVYKKGVERAENFHLLPQGAAQYRPGTVYVHHTRLNRKARFIPFQFNDQQSYLIEVTDQKFRFYKDNAIIVEAAKTITNITQANPAVITSAGHGYSNGDEFFANDIVGMTELNGKSFLVAGATANTFQITDVFGNNVNSTGYGAYVSGGTAERIYEITTPYTEADMNAVKFSQNADTMYLTHKGYAPRKLTRTGHTAWTIATYVRTNDPFTGSTKWPRAVSFTDDARLLMAGTTDNPETIYGSRAPNAGATRYEDYTTGTDDTDAVTFTVAPIRGKVDTIQWLANTDKFIIAGTFGTVRRIYGASEQEPLSPTSVTAKSVNNYGCDITDPVSNGTAVFYIQRGQQVLRSFEYDYVVDGYITTDRNLVAEHITYPGIVQSVQQQGRNDTVWSVRKDGILLGLTYKEKEDISGWHRQKIGGSHIDSNNVTRPWGKVLWAGIMPRETSPEQLWLVVERRVNEQTVRSVEYFADIPIYPQFEDYYTGEDDEDDNNQAFRDVLFETQKNAIHLDMALTYDGSSYGTAASASLTPSATTGSGVTMTASAAVFTAAMVGRQIWKKYDANGGGGGRAEITGYTDSTHVTVRVLSDFDNTNAMAAGNWFLTATNFSGLDHLEGETIGIIADGGPANDTEVSGGSVTLDSPASVAHFGLKYRGMLKTLNLDMGGVTGTAQAKKRNISQTVIKFLNSLGAKFGTSLYNLERLVFRSTADLMSRPTPLFTGNFQQKYEDGWDIEKNVFVVQDNPLPCTVLVLDVFAETTDE